MPAAIRVQTSMPATTTGRVRARGPLLSASAALGLALTMAAPASAQRIIYDVTRIAPFSKTHCTGHAAQDCVPARSAKTTVPVDTSRSIRLSCPQSHPYVVGWDARHHEHISLALLFVGRERPNNSGPRPRSDTLRIAARNNAHRPGDVWIAAGCSTKPFKGDPFMQHRSSVPSKHPGVRR